jgi:hypothetical protein
MLDGANGDAIANCTIFLPVRLLLHPLYEATFILSVGNEALLEANDNLIVCPHTEPESKVTPATPPRDEGRNQ